MNEQDFTLLDDYFNGLLSPEMVASVETRLQTDTEFAREFALRQKLEAFPARETKRQQMRATLRDLGAEYFAENNQTIAPPLRAKVNYTRWFAAAAAVTLLLMAAWWLLRPSTSLYEQYASNEPLHFTERGAADTDAATAETAFNAGKYEEALSALDRMLQQKPDNLRAQLAKGICLLELNRPAEARATLHALANGSSALQQEAIWYVALSYVRENDPAQAKATLSKLAPGDPHYDTAQALLKKLK